MFDADIKSISSKWAAIFAFQAFLSVVAGAFGAHFLAEALDPRAVGWWGTASQYLMYHAISGFVTSALFSYLSFYRAILMFFLLGNVLFSGSLFVMSLTGYSFLGVITPFGGLCYLLAWGSLILCLIKFKNVKAAENQ